MKFGERVTADETAPETNPGLPLSLITGTAGRTATLGRLLDSLSQQALRSFEWIVVDQNRDDRVEPIIRQHAARVRIRRLRTEPGLSPALNLGIRNARGAIIGFPDDDGWFAPDTLARVLQLFDANPGWDGIACRAVDAQGVPSIIRWSPTAGPCSRFNAWFRVVSTGLFFRRRVLDVLGGFDETLGVGPGLLLAAHDLDIVLRAIDAGFHIQYVTDPSVGHPQIVVAPDAVSVTKAHQYAIGAGRVMRDHRMPLWWASAAIAVPLARAGTSAARGNMQRAAMQWAEASGRLKGLLGAGGGRRTTLIDALHAKLR